MPKDIEDKIKEELLPANSEKNIAEQLKEINDLFLTKYKLKVDDIEIIPLETEIYYHNEQQKNIFKDQMIHKNELQKSRFGKLYFHRCKKKDINDETNTVNIIRGGVDICISEGNYYLSILLRSIIKIQDGNKDFISGPNNIQQIFHKERIQKGLKESEEKKEKEEKIRNGLKELEKEKILIIKRNIEVNLANVYHQKRIQDERFKEGEKYNLNSIIIEENNIHKNNDEEKDLYLIQLVQPKK